MNTDKIIIALDNYSPSMASEVIAYWQDRVYGFKINHLLYPSILEEIFLPKRTFVDYKLFDIPNTMCNIIEKLIENNVDMVTVHMNNNQKAIQSLSKYADKIKLLGVTYLTSWDENDLTEVYFRNAKDVYSRSIALMEDNGFWGMICSPDDIRYFRETSLKKICPGIRMNDDSTDDQKRVVTPNKAFALGADYLVMGRSFFKHFT